MYKILISCLLLISCTSEYTPSINNAGAEKRGVFSNDYNFFTIVTLPIEPFYGKSESFGGEMLDTFGATVKDDILTIEMYWNTEKIEAHKKLKDLGIEQYIIDESGDATWLWQFHFIKINLKPCVELVTGRKHDRIDRPDEDADKEIREIYRQYKPYTMWLNSKVSKWEAAIPEYFITGSFDPWYGKFYKDIYDAMMVYGRNKMQKMVPVERWYEFENTLWIANWPYVTLFESESNILVELDLSVVYQLEWPASSTVKFVWNKDKGEWAN